MEITAGKVEQSLETVKRRLNPILDDRSVVVIEHAKSMLRDSNCQYRESARQRRIERTVRPWGFSISPDDPLRFEPTEVGGLKLRVDLFMEEYWDDEPAEQPCKLNVAIRVWSLDPQVCFREQWDATGLRDQIDPGRGRVMIRIHFDLANPGQPGPKYHAQVGGNPRLEELCWFPEALGVPRLPHMPMDLVLASELVAATFYPDDYQTIRREDSWKGSRSVSQKHLLHDYLEKALAAANGSGSVLDKLWNKRWE